MSLPSPELASSKKENNLELVDIIQKKIQISKYSFMSNFNPLNAKLHPICHPLALLGTHHILHVSRVRVKTFSIHGGL